jgi:hypothetical protein
VDLEDLSFEIVDCIDMAQDRDQWAICGLDLYGTGYGPVGDL